MSLFLAFVTVVQVFSTSLGVGSSTLAIINFFVAIRDGEIDEIERRMMGVVYVVLRVAMALILLTTALLIAPEYTANGIANLSAFSYAEILILFVLYSNALLMTAHLVPSTIGPAIQAGSWYALGILAGLQIVGLPTFSFTTFLLGYITWLALAVGIVNGTMAAIRGKRGGFFWQQE